MRSLWLLTVKNLRLLIRSRASALIIIFAPLLIILILGLSYNNSAKFGLNIGIHANSFSEDIESFINVLEEEEFTIFRYESNLDKCIEDIKSGNIHTCISLPESLQVEDNTQKEVVFYIDPSRINLVWMIQETVNNKFNIKAQEISQDLAQNILTQLGDTKNILSLNNELLGNVGEKTISSSENVKNSKDKLSGLDLTATEEPTYDPETLTLISNNIDNSKTHIEDVLGTINGAVSDDAKRQEIRDSLNSAKESLALVLEGSGNQTSGLLADLETELSSTKEKLTLIATTVTDVNTNLEDISSSLKEAVTEIENVRVALEGTFSNLEGQKVTSADTITSPLVTKIEKVSPEGTYLNYLFPALLVMVVMFSSLLLGTTLVMIEKNSPAFLRNFFLPVRKITFITSIYITTLILILVEITVILGISLFFLKDSLSAFPSVALVLFLAASVFTFLGMAIGYIFTSEETGVLASISLGSVLLFISGVILPLEGVSELLRKITFFNPFVIAEKIVRESFIFGSSLLSMQNDLWLLISYAVGLFLVILLIESTLHKHIVHRFLKRHHRAHVQKQKREKKDA